MDKPQKEINCHDYDPNCDFCVRDSDENEVVLAAQSHAKRKHGKDLSAEQLRPMLKDARTASGGPSPRRPRAVASFVPHRGGFEDYRAALCRFVAAPQSG